MATPLEPFATIDELNKFWRTVTNEETERAETLLDMASNYLRQIAKNNSADIDESIALPDNTIFENSVKMVVLESVKRAMTTPTDAPPADSWSQAANPYSETMKFTNPSNDLYFKNNELKLLGLASLSGKSQFGILRFEG